MKRAAPTTLNRQILEEASDWFVNFRVGDVDAEASERFDEWLRRSPEHIRAYWEIAKTYVGLPPASAMSKVKADELISYGQSHTSANVVPLNPSSRIPEPRAPNVVRAEGQIVVPGRSPRRHFLAAVAFAFALLIAGAVWWQVQRYPLYATDAGERRSITLADGSTVDLNARSKLRIEFSNAERRVELMEGQALFQVAKDKHRPFLVHSGDALVRAVGTQFDVYRKDSGTTVTVLEGRVAVYSTAHSETPIERPNTASQATNTEANAPSQQLLPGASTRDFSSNTSRAHGRSGAGAELPSPPSDPSGTPAVFVSAGEQVTVTPDAIATPTPQHADLAAATAWMQRKLIFEGSKLIDVASEFNRYNTRHLVIEDSKLKDLQISGVYSSTDPASLIRFLQDQGLKVTEDERELRIEMK
jgi:transmembrane sensor